MGKYIDFLVHGLVIDPEKKNKLEKQLQIAIWVSYSLRNSFFINNDTRHRKEMVFQHILESRLPSLHWLRTIVHKYIMVSRENTNSECVKQFWNFVPGILHGSGINVLFICTFVKQWTGTKQNLKKIIDTIFQCCHLFDLKANKLGMLLVLPIS